MYRHFFSKITIMLFYYPSLASRTYVLLFESSISAGFPSPADDYTDLPLDLNELLIKNPPATFFAKISDPDLDHLGLYLNDLIIVDRSLKPCYGKLMLVIMDGELKIKKYIKKNSSGLRESCPPRLSSLFLTENEPFELWGVITYVIHPV